MSLSDFCQCVEIPNFPVHKCPRPASSTYAFNLGRRVSPVVHRACTSGCLPLPKKSFGRLREGVCVCKDLLPMMRAVRELKKRIEKERGSCQWPAASTVRRVILSGCVWSKEENINAGITERIFKSKQKAWYIHLNKSKESVRVHEREAFDWVSPQCNTNRILILKNLPWPRSSVDES